MIFTLYIIDSKKLKIKIPIINNKNNKIIIIKYFCHLPHFYLFFKNYFNQFYIM